ncbi:MAG: zf-HC2 domain-containing protein [Abditibacteriales bacterium]|nr:zf-HC2 domain-containing protein [Abditibacteriales bacterium]MDW8367964.1 zf-HC2 domain-containing protein [Abditibacteriales bacterium]
MDCKNVQANLSDFVLAELNETDTLDIVRHLASCRACALEESETRKLTYLLGAWDAVEWRADLTRRIQTAAAQYLSLLGQNTSPADAEDISWRDRWNSLIEAVRNAQRRCAPVTYSMLVAAIVGMLLVLLKQPRQPVDPTLVFLAGIWWATVANGLFRLALSGEEPTNGAADGNKTKVDLRATTIAGTAAATAVAAMFIGANLLNVVEFVQQITKNTQVGNYVPVICFSAASLVVVALSISALEKMMPHRGRISGTLVGLIYSSVIVPLLYLANECRLDPVLGLCTLGTIAGAVVGGLLGDTFLNTKTISRAWREMEL